MEPTEAQKKKMALLLWHKVKTFEQIAATASRGYPNGGDETDLQTSMLIDSFACHFKLLYEFLSKDARFREATLWSDYIPAAQQGDYLRDLLVGDKFLKTWMLRSHERIAYLTYNRAENEIWPYRVIAARILYFVLHLVELADKSLLPPSMVRWYEESCESYFSNPMKLVAAEA
jgi:hypothetical protein